MALDFKSQSACDAQASDYGSEHYWQMLEDKAHEYAARFPERAEFFMTRTLSEALAGNDGA